LTSKDKNIYFCPGCNQPLTAPIVRPFIKYLWKNGYAKIIGPTPIIAIAIRSVSPGTLANALEALLKLRPEMMSKLQR
jgi:hypothetical protein